MSSHKHIYIYIRQHTPRAQCDNRVLAPPENRERVISIRISVFQKLFQIFVSTLYNIVEYRFNANDINEVNE